jgi:oxygen-independent coproporphyrinogen-3 oxidase
MGYTTQNSGMLLGLGVSSISDAAYAYAQNHKTIHDYYAAVNSGKLATYRGYELSEEDISFRNCILQISCSGRTFFKQKDKPLLKEYVFPQLELLAADGLITWNDQSLELTASGRYFIRNICAAFDIKLHQSENATTVVFSKAI